MERKSIKNILTRFFIVSIGLFSLIFLLFISLGNLAINSGWVLPANYPESLIPPIEEKIKEGNLQTDAIPEFFDYQLKEQGEIRADTFPKRKQKQVAKAAISGKTQGATSWTREIFVPIKGDQQEIVLSYHLVSDFASGRLRKVLPSFEMLELSLFLFALILAFFFSLRHYSRKLQGELAKINQANLEIAQLNLEFSNQKSSIKEIDAILQTIDQLKNSLNDSLQQQWQLQNEQETSLQGLLHDLRTPLTLIQGNLELLAETDLSSQQAEFLQDAKKGIARLEQQTERLKQVTRPNSLESQKTAIDQPFLSRCEKIARELAKTKQLSVAFSGETTAALGLANEPLFQVIQNLLQNSVEAASEKSTLYLSFKQTEKHYQIKIRDEGPGFSKVGLETATEKNYSTKTDGHEGLGLYLGQCYMDQVGGKLQIRNIESQGEITGAEVTLIFKLASP